MINSQIKYLKQKEKELFDKSSISNLLKNSDLNTELSLLATTNKIVKFQTFDTNHFPSKSHSEDENYLWVLPVYIYFKTSADGDHISAWKSKGYKY